MRWLAHSEKDSSNAQLEKRLWDAADDFRANSGLKAQEYSGPILGLIFLRFAERHLIKGEFPEVQDDLFNELFKVSKNLVT